MVAFVLALFIYFSFLQLLKFIAFKLMKVLLPAKFLTFYFVMLVISTFVIFQVFFVTFSLLFRVLFSQVRQVFVIVLIVFFSFFIIVFLAMHWYCLFSWLFILWFWWTFRLCLRFVIVVVMTLDWYWEILLDKFKKMLINEWISFIFL